MKKNHSFSDYFSFSRKERLALLLLILVTGTLFLLPSFLPRNGRERFTSADSSWIREMAALTRYKTDTFYRQGNKQTYFKQKSEMPSQPVYFPFNPNSASPEEWSRLGLPEKTVRTILRFRERGGIFRRPEDLGRIYGLRPDDFRRLQPWIRLPLPEKPAGSNHKPADSDQPAIKPAFKKKEYRYVSINEADSAEFILLPGIGHRLAARIVAFREKLGGFYSPDQVAETWGLPDSVFSKIRPYLKTGGRAHRKMNLNTVTETELKGHPYFRWQLIRPLLAYRTEHGPFRGVEDIRKIQAISDSVFRKISPYLGVE